MFYLINKPRESDAAVEQSAKQACQSKPNMVEIKAGMSLGGIKLLV